MSRQWQKSLAAMVLLQAWILFLYRDTAHSMVAIWHRSDTFAHGFLVLPITLWLIWRKRDELSRLTPSPSPTALAMVAAAALAWLFAELGAVNAVEHLALVALVVAAVPACLGYAVFMALLFPLLFLFFGVPIGEFLLPVLMHYTADFTVMALRASGVPVYREGLQFVIPSGHWSVVEACSGVRYLIASLMIGTLFAYLTYHSWRRRLAFIAVSIVVPIVANWLRAYMIVLLGHLTNNKLAVGVDHLIYGWVFFGVVILLMFVIGSRWAEPAAPAKPRSFGAKPVRAGGGARWTTTFATILVAALLVAAPHYANTRLLQAQASQPPRNPLYLAPVGGWEPVQTPVTNWKPLFHAPTAELQSGFAKDGRFVGLHIAYYRNQDEQRKLISSRNVLVASDDTVWYQAASRTKSVAWADRTTDVQETELAAMSRTAAGSLPPVTVWRLYWVNGTWTSNVFLAKAYSVAYRLLGRGDESAAIVLYAPAVRDGGGGSAGSAQDAGKAGAQAALVAFARDGGADVGALLERVRSDR